MTNSDINRIYDARGSKRLRGSPYRDYATQSVPDSLSDIIDWSEYVMTLSDDLSCSLRRLYSCFNTPIVVTGFTEKLETVDLNKIEKFRLMLEQRLQYSSEVLQVGLNTCTYGSDFVSMTLRHTRSLICKHCGASYVLKPSEIIEKLDPKFTTDGFVGRCVQSRCPGFGQHRTMGVSDIPVKNENGIIVTHWRWRDLHFDYREGFQMLQVYYRVPNARKRLIAANDIVTLHDTDVGIMEAAISNKLFLFNEDALFHAKHPTLSGLIVNGIGLPRTLTYLKPHWLTQLLHKQVQVIARDYNTPMPYFTSSGAGGSGGFSDSAYGVHDHLQMSNMVTQMVADSRMDPGNYYYIPNDLVYRIAAAGADAMVSDKLLGYASSKLTSTIIPDALLSGDITQEAAPFWLKFFESLNVEIPMLYNQFLWWFCGRVSSLLGADTVNFQHVPMSIANNSAMIGLLAGASAQGDAAKSTFLRAIGLNYKFEVATNLAEQRVNSERDAAITAMQEKDGLSAGIGQLASQTAVGAIQGQQAAGQQPGQQPAAMAPGAVMLPSQGYQPPNDIRQMESQAPMLAQVLGEIPESQRKSELSILSSQSQAMHSLVLQQLRVLRQEVDKQNRAQTHPNL